MAFHAAGLTGLIGGFFAIFPGVWTNLFTDVEAVRMASNAYLRIAGPFYAFFGLALCLYFASLGAGRVLWPVLSIMLRVAVVLVGGLVLSGGEEARPEQFYWLIAAGMATQALVMGAAVRLGAWTRGLDQEATIPGRPEPGIFVTMPRDLRRPALEKLGRTWASHIQPRRVNGS